MLKWHKESIMGKKIISLVHGAQKTVYLYIEGGASLSLLLHESQSKWNNTLSLSSECLKVLKEYSGVGYNFKNQV